MSVLFQLTLSPKFLSWIMDVSAIFSLGFHLLEPVLPRANNNNSDNNNYRINHHYLYHKTEFIRCYSFHVVLTLCCTLVFIPCCIHSLLIKLTKLIELITKAIFIGLQIESLNTLNTNFETLLEP